ncbi:XRE family transcriptional regulator [Streptomyces ficellus]|uniref:XRE family transcriptional regulator n=1 Tax=Streptomyces ficellus TaxID=1977088 RepID=A0A6I6FMX6_9ACTN|nr:XRE family transcriptional regulator [Streptomyces ficellus]QGV78968.1 XRE family transcriptional regulator [Streptomyces ficellus]
MPRWKALPEELDPQVKEFASQLRRLVDRSGLSVAAVSDRTGYSKTSWERYLNGRLLAPKGAIVALAEVTGTNPMHLTTMWELAERAWSRAEMRHDMTMEAIRISQARAALGEFGGTAGPGADGSSRVKAAPGPGSADPAAGRGTGPAAGRAAEQGTGRAGRPSVIPPDGGPNGPARRGPAASPAAPAPKPAPASSAPRGGGRKVAMIVAAVVGVLLVIAAAVLLGGLGGDDDPGKNVAQSPSATPSTSASKALPAGVKCSGDDCTGQDPEAMGCGGEFATTTSSATVGTSKVEVRYSKTCGAAWARISQAVAGDKVTISAGGETQNGAVKIDKDAYTPMVAAADGAEPEACATLASGTKGCTESP